MGSINRYFFGDNNLLSRLRSRVRRRRRASENIPNILSEREIALLEAIREESIRNNLSILIDDYYVDDRRLSLVSSARRLFSFRRSERVFIGVVVERHDFQERPESSSPIPISRMGPEYETSIKQCNNDWYCPVCLCGGFKTILQFQCNHGVCNECFNNLRQHNLRNCPLCRGSIITTP